MVQLKHYDSKIYGYKAEEFQFHNGTIKTLQPTSVQTQQYIDFNSIMVQLKLSENCLI